jgi:chitodextrinase
MRVGLVGLAVSIAIAAWGPAVASGHHGFTTAAGHMAEDDAPHDAAQEAALTRKTALATATDAAVAAAAAAGNEDQVGTWGPLVNWPVVGIHVALLPNGKVLAYDSVGDAATETFPVHNFTRATVWDPQTGTQTPVNVNTGFNVFCSGLAHLSDGMLFVAGGNKNSALDGIVQTHVFNYLTNTWSLGPNMQAERWYPTVTPLRNGEMLITEGGPDIPEVRTTGGTLRTLTTASLNLPLYPWMDVAPDGRTFYSGPDQTMRKLDTTGTGTWQTFGQRDPIDRSYGGHALYDVGKMLIAGGGSSTPDARIIDINGATPQVTATAPMANGRRQHNLTVLADGTVLATGGNSSGASLVDLNNGVYAAELWNPATGTWKTLAAEQATRQYHSTALLLPDGRVLSAGGGICGTCDQVGYLAKNAQVFTPPYLYKSDGSGQLATRPQVTAAPASVDHATNFQIDTPDAAAIRKVALVRLGAVTHSVNMEQRYVPLSFTAGTSSLTATAPANANIAPPGVYMLFVVDAAGVPSVAKMVTVTGAAPPPPPPPPNSGIVAAWGFSEGSGTTTTDASGNGNVGTITGATWSTQGRYGNALSFNGSGNIVRVASSASLNLTTGMTLSAWVRPTAAQGGWRTVLQRQTDAYFLHASNGDGPLRPAGGGTFGGSTDFVGGPSAIAVNAWTHLAVTYDLATVRLYVNGTQVATRADTGAIQTSSNPLWIGGNSPYGEYFQGLIDEARVYNRALTPAEIQTDMNTAVTPPAPDPTPPSTPTGLNATAASSSAIDLNWTASSDNIGVTGYRVERCQGAGCTNFAEVGSPAGNAYSDTGLAPATAYRYQVRATDAAGNLSGYSAIASATTPAAPDTTAPSAPTGLTATAVSTSQIDLAWTASTDNVGVTGYRVERCQGASCTNYAQVGTPTTTTFSNTGLAANTTYRFRVRAADAAGNLSAYSAIVNRATLASDTTAPTAPTGLAATAVSPTQIDLSWTASTDNVGVTGYRVERCQGATCTTFAQVGTPTATSYSSTGLTASTTYRFRVRAADAAGNLSAYSSIVNATTPAVPDNSPPTDPSGLAAAAVGSAQVNLNWTASTDNVGVATYSIERCIGQGCTGFAEIGTSTTASYSNTGLSASTTYRYRVRAADAAGNLSGYSGVAEATTGATSPVPPGLVGAWGFSEGAGSTTADASGGGNVATITGATWTNQGRFGNALSFNGAGNVLRVASSASLNLTSGMTLSAWIRPTASQTGWRTIVQRQADAYFLTAGSDAGTLRPAGGGTIGGGVSYVTGPTANPLNTWTHVAVSYDGANLRIFINGAQVATRVSGGSIQTVANPLWIGGNTPYGEYFQGLIDEVRVYNRALTAGEIQTDMNAPVDQVAPAGQAQALRLPALLL